MSKGTILNSLMVPAFEASLPRVMEFLHTVSDAFETRQISSWQDMTGRVRKFFSPGILREVDAVAPGFEKMASYAEGLTLVHVTCVFTGMLASPEYRQASPEKQELMKWIVLFHDVEKKVIEGKRDQTHAFRSAAQTAEALPPLGFQTTEDYASLIGDWMALTRQAVMKDSSGVEIQDNRALPLILEGTENLFGKASAGSLAVKTILLHASINVVREWPQAAPLTLAEARAYIAKDLLPFLKMMTLADNDGWSLFEPTLRAKYRRETLEAFEAIT